MHSGPLQLQESVAQLMLRVDADPRLHSEQARARREFFGEDPPPYLSPGAARAAGELRFAEWFVLERISDVLGATPLDALYPDVASAPAMLRGTRVGVFLVEASGDEDLRVRDLDGGEQLALSGLLQPLAAGDLLIGRVYPSDDGSYVPSSVAAVLRAAADFAVAYQKDLRRLDLDRRLSQAEVEHLLFRRVAVLGATPPGDAPRPVERLEAELQVVFEQCGKDDVLRATTISAMLRRAAAPGEVIGPLLDEMAFDTGVDLDQLRRLLHELAHAVRPAAAPDGGQERAVPTRGRRPAPRFEPRPGETLGERLARRIEEGLSRGEPIDAVFEDVEELFGEPIDDEAGDGESGDGATADGAGADEFADGDLVPFVREFAWETGLDAASETVLGAFVLELRGLPVPRAWSESLETEDVLRFLLRRWIEAAPERRLAVLAGSTSVLERFFEWLATEQDVDRRALIADCRARFVDDAQRLHDAAVALDSAAPAAGPACLLRVVGIGSTTVHAVSADERREYALSVAPRAALLLREGDFVLAGVVVDAAGQARLSGRVVVLPPRAEPLLG